MNADHKQSLLQELRTGGVKAVVDRAIDGLADKSVEALQALGDREQYAPLGAEWRRGLKDLQDAVLVAFPESMKSRDEPGTIVNPTQMLVTEAIKGKEYSLDEFSAIAKQNAQHEAEQGKEHEREIER